MIKFTDEFFDAIMSTPLPSREMTLKVIEMFTPAGAPFMLHLVNDEGVTFMKIPRFDIELGDYDALVALGTVTMGARQDEQDSDTIEFYIKELEAKP